MLAMDETQPCAGCVCAPLSGHDELNGLCSLRRDGLEDPLDDAGLVQQQLDQLSTIGRCEYEKTCALLVQLFDQAAQTYQELLQSTNSSAVDVTVQEGKCRRPVQCQSGPRCRFLPTLTVPPLDPSHPFLPPQVG